MSTYLKESLQTNISKKVKMLQRKGSYPNKFDPAKMQHLYIFGADNIEYSHYASDTEQETLQLFQPGDYLTVTRRELDRGGKRIYFNDWTAEGDVTVKAPQPLRTATAEHSFEKKASQNKNEYDLKQKQISIHGMYNSWLVALSNVLGQQKAITPELLKNLQKEAREKAIEDAKWIENIVKEPEQAEIPAINIDYTPSISVENLPF